MSTYIYVLEDGSLLRGGEPTEDDIRACDDGLVTIIDPVRLTEYHQGKWVPIERGGIGSS